MAFCTALGLLAGFALGGMYFHHPPQETDATVCAESPPCGKWSLRQLNNESWHFDFDSHRRHRHSVAIDALEEEEVEIESGDPGAHDSEDSHRRHRRRHRRHADRRSVEDADSAAP